MLGYGGEPTGPGLTADEREAVEERFGFRFASVHRAFLAMGVPAARCGRTGGRDRRGRCARGSGSRPTASSVTCSSTTSGRPAGVCGPQATTEREAVARAELERVPALVPLFARCYLPAGDARPECPVLAVDRTIVVRAGHDLEHYVGREFAVHDTAPAGRALRVPFWSDLAELFDAERPGPGIMAP